MKRNGLWCKLHVGWDMGLGWRLLWCGVLYGCGCFAPSVCPISQSKFSWRWTQTQQETCLSKQHSYSIKRDAQALIMDVSSSWRGGKALIYTHRFPGIFMGLAKCHYTAGEEVMKCNKLWCGWVCVSCRRLINQNSATSLQRSPTTCHPFTRRRCTSTLVRRNQIIFQYKHIHIYSQVWKWKKLAKDSDVLVDWLNADAWAVWCTCESIMMSKSWVLWQHLYQFSGSLLWRCKHL